MTLVVLEREAAVEAHSAAAGLFTQRGRRHAQAGRLVEIDEARLESVAWQLARLRAKMVVEAVEFDSDDVSASGPEMQAGSLQHRR